MKKFLSEIDQLLRGQFTQPEDLSAGRIVVPVRTLVVGGLVLGCLYGLFMGLYGVMRPKDPTGMQLFSTTLKVPLLFLLTLLVTLPSLYVLSALAGSRLRFRATMRLLLAAIAINLALLASLGPVLGFFTLSTQSYPFMIVINVFFFGVAGIAGLVFLRRALTHVFQAAATTPLPAARPAAGDDTGQAAAHEADPEAGHAADPEAGQAMDPEAGQAMDPEPAGPEVAAASHIERARVSRAVDNSLHVFRGWLVVYGVVGAQMGWILRPFIGSPDLPFEWFRERESHFLAGLFAAIGKLFQ